MSTEMQKVEQRQCPLGRLAYIIVINLNLALQTPKEIQHEIVDCIEWECAWWNVQDDCCGIANPHRTVWIDKGA